MSFCANLSHYDENTVLPPIPLEPNLIPLIPANKSICVNLSSVGSIYLGMIGKEIIF